VSCFCVSKFLGEGQFEIRLLLRVACFYLSSPDGLLFLVAGHMRSTFSSSRAYAYVVIPNDPDSGYSLLHEMSYF